MQITRKKLARLSPRTANEQLVHRESRIEDYQVLLMQTISRHDGEIFVFSLNGVSPLIFASSRELKDIDFQI